MKEIDLNPRTLRLPIEEVAHALIDEGMNRLSALDIVTTAYAWTVLRERKAIFSCS